MTDVIDRRTTSALGRRPRDIVALHMDADLGAKRPLQPLEPLDRRGMGEQRNGAEAGA